MSSLFIKGHQRLKGSIKIQGAKNSALPILVATILTSTECILHNCPHLSDVYTTIKILEYLGAKVKWHGESVAINASGVNKHDIPLCFMNKMRSSVVFLGAIASKMSKVKAFFPGGCELGPRPIDLHLEALKKLGLIVDEDYNCINCKVKGKLKGAKITLKFPSVGATENIVLASVLADGVTIIENAAKEPEIYDLCDFLIKCGAKIQFFNSGTIKIVGVKRLIGCEHNIIPDRIAATTFMAAAAVTHGDLLLENINLNHLSPVIPFFEESGCVVITDNDNLRIMNKNRLLPMKKIKTMPHPGFPTDAQAIVMVMCALAEGRSVFEENIFTDRYKHVSELLKFGAKIDIDGKIAVVNGVDRFFGNKVVASDLRGGAALVIAGIAAYGETQVFDIYHIDRGYENIEGSFNSIGANIKRI